MKFRNCFFEYDGVYSGQYDLRLVYVENSNRNFDSGGNFDFKFGQIPYSHEQLYYGKDYSVNPLQFEIEIMNIDGYIPDKQMTEIKEWLFGKSGWKKFKVLDGRNDVSLRCVLIPIADITERDKYKGLRFTLRNASPFWYGEEEEIVLNNSKLRENVQWDSGYTWDRWCTLQIDIPDNNCVNMPIYPVIEAKPRRNTNTNADGVWSVGTYFALSNTPAKSLNEGKAFANHKYNIEENSRISCSLDYMKTSGDTTTYSYTVNNNIYTISVNGNVVCTVIEKDDKYKISINGEDVGNENVSDYTNLNSDFCKPVVAALNHIGYRVISNTEVIYAMDNLTIDTQYCTVQSEAYPDLFVPIIINEQLPKPVFNLHYGTNICRIYFGHIYESITIKYTPLYRMGAF